MPETKINWINDCEEGRWQVNQSDLNYFKDILQEWLEGLESQAENTVSNFMQYDEHTPGPLDQAAREFERNFTLRIHNRQDVLIRKIKQSLRDIEEGEYGNYSGSGSPRGRRALTAAVVFSVNSSHSTLMPTSSASHGINSSAICSSV
jgi:RNA polymerase-binding protein DksA